MKCAECVKQGFKSVVYPGGGSVTAMFYQPYYDENGEYHHHDGNTITERFSCSNGHIWTETSHQPCPNPKCDWGKSEA